MAPATAAGLSTGTHVLAPETGTSVARGKSEASRRAWSGGKKRHSSPQISRTGRPKRGDLPGGVEEELRAEADHGGDEVAGHPPVPQRRAEQRLGAPGV
jgi:hypothetical protein